MYKNTTVTNLSITVVDGVRFLFLKGAKEKAIGFTKMFIFFTKEKNSAFYGSKNTIKGFVVACLSLLKSSCIRLIGLFIYNQSNRMSSILREKSQK